LVVGEQVKCMFHHPDQCLQSLDHAVHPIYDVLVGDAFVQLRIVTWFGRLTARKGSGLGNRLLGLAAIGLASNVVINLADTAFEYWEFDAWGVITKCSRWYRLW